MIAKSVYRAAAGEAPEDRGAARRFATHIGALVCTKTADGLIDPKLVLAWLLGALGAPGYLIGALVPVREAGALLPQLGLARAIEARRVRKPFWIAGSAVQGAAALGMAAAALTLTGAAAGWAILACLAVLATARAACSASYKDILSRTVEKGLRGKTSGVAGTVGAAAVFAFAIMLSVEIIPREPLYVAGAVALAGALWLLAAAIFATLDEPEAEDADADRRSLSTLVEPLKRDGEFRLYVAVRALLISTALAPPFLVMLGGQSQDAGFANLGILILASSLAAIASSYLWGALSDRSSRKTLAVAGAAAAVALGGAAAMGFATGGLGPAWIAGIFVFAAQIAYQGARAGRKTHLTDMDAEGRTAVYTALSNTMIGALLLVGGVFGVIADMAGAEVALALLASLAGFGAVAALGLSEVQEES